MADASAKVKAAVRRALQRNPDLKSRDVFEQIVKTHKEVADLSVRQFHAQYVIQAKRELAPPKAASSGAAKPKARKPAKPKKRTSTRRRPAAKPALAATDIAAAVQARIDEARKALTAAVDGAAARAATSGRIADYDKLQKALVRAAGALDKI